MCATVDWLGGDRDRQPTSSESGRSASQSNRSMKDSTSESASASTHGASASTHGATVAGTSAGLVRQYHPNFAKDGGQEGGVGNGAVSAETATLVLVSGGEDVTACTRLSSYRPNLHVEMMAMAASMNAGEDIHSLVTHLKGALPHRAKTPGEAAVTVDVSDEIGSEAVSSTAAAAATGGGAKSSIADEMIMLNSYQPSVRERAFTRVQSVAEAERYGGAVDAADGVQEGLTDKAVEVIRRVMDKLNGLDFNEKADSNRSYQQTALGVTEQVDRLITQASSDENLCLGFIGWCPFW